MALEIILWCLAIVTALNTLLIYDLYNRSARLAAYANALNLAGRKLAHLVSLIKP